MAVNKFRWQRKSNDSIWAVHWNGINRLEIEQFFDTVRWAVAVEDGPYFSRDEEPDDPYNTITFYCTDDHEVDPDWWIVLYRDGYGGVECHIMSDDEFYDEYERPTK